MTSSNYLRKTSQEYYIYVCQTRAIPLVTDGLKHVQRMALWLLRHRAEKIKTIALGGLLAYEKLYVHGDVSANDAIGDLAAPYKNNIPLIEGLGHFGSKIAPDAIGAPRYTEVRRSKAAEALLYKDLDIVPLEDNYDGSNKQPVHFLPLIPLVLLNGVSGIAVGWSTNVLPHDLKSLIDATKAALLGKPLKSLEPRYTNYDIAVDNIGINRWEFTGKAAVIDVGTVHITELPPGLTIEAFRKRLIVMDETHQIRDFTDKSTDKIDITIKMKRNAQLEEISEPLKYPHNSITEWSDKQLIDFFKLRERVMERIVVIVHPDWPTWDGKSVKTYDTAEQLLIDFVAWRLQWYTKRFHHLVAQDGYELTYWLALRILFNAQFPKRLGTFKDKTTLQSEVNDTLARAELVLDAHQLDRVINLPTYRWTMEFEGELDGRIADIRAAISAHERVLASPDMLRDVYLKELDDLKALK